MDVLFLIEAGGRYGLGHLMRSAVLMKALAAGGIHSVTALRSGGGSVPEWALPAGKLYMLDDNNLAVARAESLARECKPRWAVIDGYDFLAGNAVKQIKLLGVRVLAFDDLGVEGGGANIVVNQNSEAEDTSARQRRLLGPAYALVDPMYAASGGPQVVQSVERVLVTFGGSDLHGMTGRVVSALTAVPGRLKVDIVIGPHHRTREFAWTGSHRLTFHDAPHGLAALLKTNDVVISAAGGTCWQACCSGIPLIAIQTVDNQREVVACLAAHGCAITFGRPEFSRMLETGQLFEVLQRLSDPMVRHSMIVAQRRLVDGNGAARIVAAMGL